MAKERSGRKHKSQKKHKRDDQLQHPRKQYMPVDNFLTYNTPKPDEEEFINLHPYSNPIKRPRLEPDGHKELLSKVDRVQQCIKKRSLWIGLPPPDRNTDHTEVTFGERVIGVTVTYDGHVAGTWINQQRGQNIFGLDMEWRPSFRKGCENKTALLQLCTETSCLIIQLLFADFIPEVLVSFLRDPDVKLVGVGIENDVVKLRRDHGLECKGQVELTHLAARRLEKEELEKVGLKRLASEVLGLSLLKPKKITMSNWSVKQLSRQQIEYACIDAFVSFAIGNKLLKPQN
eukprot:Gb_21005 [translate_table: standard]